jgi:hypothetical protein
MEEEGQDEMEVAKEEAKAPQKGPEAQGRKAVAA